MTLKELFGEIVSRMATRKTYAHEWTDGGGKKYARYNIFLSEKQALTLTDKAKKEEKLRVRNYAPKKQVQTLLGLNAEIDCFWSLNKAKYFYILTWKSHRPPMEMAF